jgi:curved DNA-binding protein CbpA
VVEPDQTQPVTSRPLPEYMSLLAKNRSTGILVAASSDARRDFVFVNGELRAATSSLEEEKLGLFLVDREKITDGERALSLLSQDGADALPLGHLLVKRGCIDYGTLETELEELTLTILRQAAGTPRVHCDFQDGLRRSHPDTLPNLTTTEAILIAARALPDFEAKLRAVGSLEQVAWPSSALDTLLNELTLTPTEAFLLSRLDGSRTLGNLIAVSPLSREEAISTIYGLKVAGIVQAGSTPYPAPARAPMPSHRRQRMQQNLLVVDESHLATGQQRERQEIKAQAERLVRLDHYRALELRAGASPAVIREAWDSIQKRCAPQRSAEPHLRDLRSELSAIVERAGEAFEVLSNPTARRRYDAILESIETEQHQRAATDLRAPDQKAREELAEANFRRAEELEREGEIYLAIRLLEQACAMEPRPAGLLRLARLLLRNPLWSNRALETIRKAIQVDPGFVDGWVELAEFWRRRNNSERQRKALERALAANPDDPRATQMYQQLLGRRELDRLRKLFKQRAK